MSFQVKAFLMEAELPDPGPLLIVSNRIDLKKIEQEVNEQQDKRAYQECSWRSVWWGFIDCLLERARLDAFTRYTT